MIVPQINPLSALLITPLAAAACLALIRDFRWSARMNAAASAIGLLFAALLFFRRPPSNDYLFADNLNVTFIGLNALIGFTTSLFSATYVAHELQTGRLTPRYLRFYHATFQLMLFAMALALTANNIGLMWVAVELATLSTVMMVGLYRTHEALEAAWKYFILGSVGIALALFGTILVYLAAVSAIGGGMKAMAWTNLFRHAADLDPSLLNVAFVFVLLGYGTKVGLAPMHAWLPDAHAEGPTPVSAVLSGLLLNVALYALLRFKMIMSASPHTIPVGPLMIAIGLGSLCFAALMLYRRRDVKRLCAYSSIEHMGLIVFAFGVGGPLANFAGLLQLTMHSLTKSAIFFSVGRIAQATGTQKIADIRGLTTSHPMLGWTLVAGVAAIAGLPPFGLFASEFLILTSAFVRDPSLAAIAAAGLLLAMGALFLRLASMAFGEPAEGVHSRVRLSCADFRPSRSRRPRRPLFARSDYGVVPQHRRTSQMTISGAIVGDPFSGLPGTRLDPHRPWPRISVDEGVWRESIFRLADGSLTLAALWGDCGSVHMAVADARDLSRLCVLSLSCARGTYPSVGRFHAPAIRLERAIFDLFGIVAEETPDARPWLDHGAWGLRAPLGAQPNAAPALGNYRFLPVDAENFHEIAVGPVHAGIIEPGHFRFAADGESIIRLEERLGYAHKGVESLFQGATIERGAQLASRCSGDSTVAYALAFARAVEAALDWPAPPRAVWLRALMAEIERLANHFGDFGAVCNDAGFGAIFAHCSTLREQALRASAASFGHRLLMDRIAPGGVTRDLDRNGVDHIRALSRDTKRRFKSILALYDETASLQDRTVGAGIVPLELAARFGAGGFVGRASGRFSDARRQPGYPPYDQLDFDVPMRTDGDVNARLWIRALEIEQSFGLVDQILSRLPEGPIFSDRPYAREACEGAALVEGFRGDVFAWIRLDEMGQISRCHLRDPSWFQWPLLEAAVESAIVADFPLCNKSFNCSYSGHDL